MAGEKSAFLIFLIFIASWKTIRSDCPVFENEMVNGSFIYEQENDFNLTHVPPNYILRFRCDEGYQLTKPRYLICGGEEWNDELPRCLKPECSDPPEIANTTHTVSSKYIIGSQVEYSCIPGYESNSSGIFTCSLIKKIPKWKGKRPLCVEKESCTDPGIPADGFRLGNCCFISSVVTYSCKDGYELVGNDSLSCLADGMWNSSRPRCRPQTGFCPDPPEIKNGRTVGAKRGDYYSIYDEVEIICDPKYAFYGENRYVLCDDDLNWDEEFGECLETFCARPNVPTNGTITELLYTYASEFAEQSELTYDCDEGFQLIGDEIRACNGGKWSGKEPYCREILCHDPNIPENGMRDGDSFIIGAKVVFSCFSGFDLVGSSERYCLPNGQWSNETARCNFRTNHCPNPGIPVNGKKIGNRYGQSDKVKFSCYSGFTLIGSKIRECLENGSWSGQEPKCLGAYDFDNKDDISDTLKKAIDDKAEEQAKELENFENSMKKIRGTIVRERKLDLNSPRRLILYFVFDVSGSVRLKNFKKSIKFAKALVKKVKVSQDGARVGALTFSSKVEEQFLPLQYSKTEDVLNHLDKINFTKGGTATTSVLNYILIETVPLVRENLGYDLKSVVFLLTDGKANMGGNPKKQADTLKKAGVEIYCIGITGSIQKNGLYDLASTPYNEHVFILNSYNLMDWLIQEITNGTVDYSQCGLGLEKNKRIQRERILNGGVVKEPWPWMVAIHYKMTDKFTKLECGASIIGQRFILTAAHCLVKNETELPITKIIVKLGLTNVSNVEKLQNFEAEIFYIHPQYDPEILDYDIAIIKLKRLIEYNQHIRPICLPASPSPQSELYVPEKTAFAIGWGTDEKVEIGEEKHTKSVDNLKQIRLPLQDRNVCLQSLLDQTLTKDRFTDRMFCAGTGDGSSDTCSGDSGGPLMQSQFNTDGTNYWTQIGIVSWGLGCGVENTYGIYTHVQNILPWIRSVINGQKI